MELKKNELVVIDNDMVDLFNEFLKVINCECQITDGSIVINDLLFEPALNIAGFKFSFDENDIEMNFLLGQNGTKLNIPFDFKTNDKLRRVICDILGEHNSFFVSRVSLDSKNNEIGFVKLKAEKYQNTAVDINIKYKKSGVHFEFLEKNGDIDCSVSFYDHDNSSFIDKEIKIKYKKMNKTNEKSLGIYNYYFDCVSRDDSYSTFVKVEEYHPQYYSDPRRGKIVAKYNDSEKRDIIDEIDLVDRQIDVYFGDLCFNAKAYVENFKLNIEEISPNLLDLLLKNYPSINVFFNTIYSGENKGLTKNMFHNYFQNKNEAKLFQKRISKNLIRLNAKKE